MALDSGPNLVRNQVTSCFIVKLWCAYPAPDQSNTPTVVSPLFTLDLAAFRWRERIFKSMEQYSATELAIRDLLSLEGPRALLPSSCWGVGRRDASVSPIDRSSCNCSDGSDPTRFGFEFVRLRVLIVNTDRPRATSRA